MRADDVAGVPSPPGRSQRLDGSGRGGRLLVGVSCGLVVAGCARPVAVDPPGDLSPQAVAACAELMPALPATLSTVGRRREVRPDDPRTAAWGDPPVSLRCGVPTPAALRADSQLVEVNGVQWLPEELTGGWLMTTVGRTANVEITVPDDHSPAPSIAADLASAVSAHDPVTGRS